MRIHEEARWADKITMISFDCCGPDLKNGEKGREMAELMKITDQGIGACLVLAVHTRGWVV